MRRKVRWTRDPAPQVNTQFVPTDKVKLCKTARYVGGGRHVCECQEACAAFARQEEADDD